jgi:eukaryotic-like serine/threonine-protein kinase
MSQKIGQYTVVSQLGRGGMGVVYKARDESLNRFVAIKVLTEKLTEDPTYLQRFVREAQAAAALSHPNVVQIYFIGEDNDQPYFVMEYVAGRSLDQIIRTEGRVDNPRASQLVLQAAHGLAAAHDLGIVHRDIKPANLMLEDRGLLKIADFGLALPADAETRLTATGMFVGTPGYLSPEQCAGEIADHRTDIYALGVTYYMLLTGTPPFRGESPLALIKQILDANPPDVSTLNPHVDDETRRILGKMIAKDREQRYQSCHDLVADLENLLATRGVRSMTAGLATRTPSSSPEIAAAMAASTQALGATAPKMSDPQAGTETLRETPLAAETLRETPLAAETLRETPLVAEPTQPGMPSDVPLPAAVAAQSRHSSSRAFIVVAVLFLLFAGGAVAAVVFGTRMFRSAVTAPQEAVATPADGTPAANPPQEVLLSQAMVPNTMPVENKEPEPALLADLAPSPADAPSLRPEVRGEVRTDARSEVRPEPRSEKGVASPAPARTNAPVQSARTRSGVAIAAIGDPGIADAVASVLRTELEASGLEVVDAQALPATEDLLRSGNASVKRLTDALRSEGFAVLVLARVDPTGQRELSFYGRRDTAYSSRVTLTTYDLASGRPLGSTASAPIEYTSINAQTEAQDVVGPLARASARAIRGQR